MLRVSYVFEGATDYAVLDAIVERFLDGKDYLPTPIQPPISEYANSQGPLGGGWKGVIQWCEQAGVYAESFVESVPLLNCDCLIIHLDADIAMEADLVSHHLHAPCPPAKDTCDRIKAYIIRLLRTPLPPKVVLCIPAQCIEAWVLAALYPDLAANFQPLECRNEPEDLLIGKPDKLVRRHDGRSRKDRRRYEMAAERIASGWPSVVVACAEALQFDIECRAALGV